MLFMAANPLTLLLANLVSNDKNAEYINKKLLNVYNKISCPERLACYFKDGKLICYMNGGDKFIYNPVDKSIEKQETYILGFDFNEDLIRRDLLDGIIENIKNKDVKISDVSDQLRERYNITKKTIKKKDTDEIMKYEQAMKKK